MALDKKKKKQLDAAKTKLERIRQLLNAARQQPDEPQDIVSLRQQMSEVEEHIRKIHSGDG